MTDFNRNFVIRTDPPAGRPALPNDGTQVYGNEASAAALTEFLRRYRRVAVLTGAGLSTGSGIPDYRDDDGNWKHARPVQYGEFTGSPEVRRRYWARSFHGWQRIAAARPNAAHEALAQLEHAGRITGIVTQNVDDLHRRAGSRKVIDLHGVLSRVRCLDCDALTSRTGFQAVLARCNPDWQSNVTAFGPDGDSLLATSDFSRFDVPGCTDCNGVLKPDVVFFGESVPASRVARAAELVAGADALLVVGSSLMVFSGFRFARMAHVSGRPLAILNRGVTRADALAAVRLSGDCATILARSIAELGA